MKILLATPIYPPEAGGPATYVRELSEHLHTVHDITVVALARHPVAFPGTRLVAVNKDQNIFLRLFQFTWTLIREAKHADVIYVQNAMAAGLPAAIAGMIRHKPVIVKFVGDEAWERATQHGKTTKRLEEFYLAPEGGLRTTLMMLIQGFVLRHVTLVTTPSSYLCDEIVRTYRINPKRAQVNYNAAEETATPPFEATPVIHQIATTARLVAWKGVGDLIRALALAQKNIPDITLVIAGDGPERESLEALVSELNLEKSVKFLGNVSRTETWHLRKESEIYVLNSTYEGLPHTVLTSFAAHIPVIATDIAGTNEAVYHDTSGLLVQPHDPASLARAIEKLLSDKELQHKLVIGGSKILAEKFSWETHIHTLEGFLHSVCPKPGN